MAYPVSTSIHLTADPTYTVPYEIQIKRLTDGGFRFLDFNFLDLTNSTASPFVGNDWLAFVEHVGEIAAKNGAVFNQAHAPVYDGIRYPGMTDADVFRYQERAILGCARLGIPWMVYHPIYTEDPDWMRINHREFDKVVELSKKYNVGMAFENTWILRQNVPLWQTEALVELCDSYCDPIVGICWDTGHGNVYGGKPELKRYTDQYREITKLGKRLKALHINDNSGIVDDHVAPFEGKIDWDAVMRALKDIGYKHSFTYEAHNAVRRIPLDMPDIVDQKIRYMHELGEKLVSRNG